MRGGAPSVLAGLAAIATLGFGWVAGCADRTAEGRDVRSDSTLARLVAELQPLIERSAGLQAIYPPHVARSDEERLRGYLLDQLHEQVPRETAEALTAVYARFGLVPDTLDLIALLVGLYEEQVAGFYDPRADTLFVLDHVDPDQLELVLAHELVHALQGQHVDLDSLTRALVDRNDRATAAQAAIEGHATLAMLEWQLGEWSGETIDLSELPDLGEQLAGLDLIALGEADLPALGRAPRIVREALVFPYVGGVAFVQRLWRERDGRPAPFGPFLPTSTEQVLHPERFLAVPRDEPTELRYASPPPEGWTEIRSDDLGELETRIFLEEWLDDAERAREAAAGWDGDRYRLLRGRGVEVLVWASVWDRDRDADEFTEAARDAFARRYGGIGARMSGRRVLVDRREVDGRPVVLVLDAPRSLGLGRDWPAARFRIGGPQ